MSLVRSRRRRMRARRPRARPGQGPHRQTLGNAHSEASPLTSVRRNYEATRTALLIVIPAVGLWRLYFLWPLLRLAWLVGAVYYAYEAYQGRMFSIPIVSKFTAQYAVTEK